MYSLLDLIIVFLVSDACYHEPNCITTMNRLLRRTLVLSVILIIIFEVSLFASFSLY